MKYFQYVIRYHIMGVFNIGGVGGFDIKGRGLLSNSNLDGIGICLWVQPHDAPCPNPIPVIATNPYMCRWREGVLPRGASLTMSVVSGHWAWVAHSGDILCWDVGLLVLLCVFSEDESSHGVLLYAFL